ncbi:hypothetical protein J8N05_19265 [Streptomyces sp. BH-SS-21]|uniref:Uncharacterized protein n=1 Tax=Streptomyces liliiviolaceus TaxID=2823109 RepID=A0A940Y483_9ACTN|nr:hypothetical protein [Streptomyces liliiviolaceus]MBQ0850329.1 hypothetical protein [Streptomyces liliiviolaceus]
MSEDALRTMLADRSGLPADTLWASVHFVPRTFGMSWPLTGARAEEVLSALLDELRRVLPPPLQDEPDGRGHRYVYLSEITDRYERCDTRRILDRIHAAGPTAARPAFGGEDYHPRSEDGWGARPSAAADLEGIPTWGWWRAVRAAGPRPYYRMPNPYVGDEPPPVDRALDLRGRAGNDAVYRAALLTAVREDPRQIDCWAHLGSDAFERAGGTMSPCPRLWASTRRPSRSPNCRCRRCSVLERAGQPALSPGPARPRTDVVATG